MATAGLDDRGHPGRIEFEASAWIAVHVDRAGFFVVDLRLVTATDIAASVRVVLVQV